jgi:hypothetical protein
VEKDELTEAIEAVEEARTRARQLERASARTLRRDFALNSWRLQGGVKEFTHSCHILAPGIARVHRTAPGHAGTPSQPRGPAQPRAAPLPDTRKAAVHRCVRRTRGEMLAPARRSGCRSGRASRDHLCGAVPWSLSCHQRSCKIRTRNEALERRNPGCLGDDTRDTSGSNGHRTRSGRVATMMMTPGGDRSQSGCRQLVVRTPPRLSA